jgi:hypothetical protein
VDDAKLPHTTEEQAYFSYIRLLQWKFLSLKAERTFQEQTAHVRKQLLAAAEELREETQRLQDLKLQYESEERLVSGLELLKQQVSLLGRI